VDLDRMTPSPHVDGRAAHGGYCGPAVKPIALRMVGEIARDPECEGLPISAIGGINTWRDAAEFMALGATNVQVCTAAMVFGFKIVEDMIDGLNNWMDEKGYRTLSEFTGKAVPSFVDWEHLNLQYVVKARIDQDLCIQCGRCHIACEDTSHQAITKEGRPRTTKSRRNVWGATCAWRVPGGVSPCAAARSRSTHTGMISPRTAIGRRIRTIPAWRHAETGTAEQRGPYGTDHRAERGERGPCCGPMSCARRQDRRWGKTSTCRPAACWTPAAL
jgi:NAD-dependent dihydropyrimidine dehydrogenase PreA subunit